jgi:acetyltransferase
LDKLFKPRSIAVAGASARGGIGAKLLSTLQCSGFCGDIWVISRTSETLGGLPCFPSIGALPGVPDCLLVSVPAPAVQEILEQAARLGVESAIVVSEGFADTNTDEGRARQSKLRDLAKRTGMAIVGPNSIGIASLRHGLVSTITDVVPRHAATGSISIVSQSGGLLLATSELCANRGIGLDKLIGTGNQAALDFAGYIHYLRQDPGTSVIGIIIEGTTDGLRLREALETAARAKPVVALKLGRSDAGGLATVAHTGTIAGRHEVFNALFLQTGVTSVNTIDELVETCALFEQTAIPRGNGVGIMTISGGATSLISDLGEALKLKLPDIDPVTNARVCEILDIDRPFHNPVDTVGLPRLLKDDNLEQMIGVLAAVPEFDVLGFVLPMRLDGSAVQDQLMQRVAKSAKHCGKPFAVISVMSGSLNGRWRGYWREEGLPLLEDVEGGLRALRHLTDYARFRARTPSAAPRFSSPSALPAVEAGSVLNEAQSKRVLANAGLPVTKECVAHTPQEAGKLAQSMEGAVAVKVVSADIPHKSDVGGVALNITGFDHVVLAAQGVLCNARAKSPSARIDGVLVQEMVDPGIELILGMTYDPQFGPVVVLGAGGANVEILKDSVTRMPPLSKDDVREMLGQLRIAPLLGSYRGSKASDVEALIDACVRFARFVTETHGQYASIDVNPLIVMTEGKGVRVADAMIVTNAKWQARSSYP